jgi:2-haloacid dehalogenase
MASCHLVDTASRWASFDCYGTLVDWNAGIRAELERLLGDGEALLEPYHEAERRVQRERPDASYREVMSSVLAELASERGIELPEDERDALGR